MDKRISNMVMLGFLAIFVALLSLLPFIGAVKHVVK